MKTRSGSIKSLQLLFVGAFFAVPTLGSANGDLDFMLMSQRSFCSAAMKSLGDAGIAVAGDVSAGQMNPALMFASIGPGGVGAAALGYARDSLWDRHIVPFAIGYSSGKGALGGMYRYQKGNGGITNNGITMNLSGLMFENSDVQGIVDFGLNVRYEWMSIDRQHAGMLPVERFMTDTAGKATFQSATDSSSVSFRQAVQARRWIVDIGFYQPDFIDHFDFGLVVRNLAGYEWEKSQPTLVWADSSISDTVLGSDTATRFDRTYAYRDAQTATRGWIDARYRIFIIGAAYRIDVNESFGLCFPLDLELFGLFNKKMKNSFVFRGGASALVKKIFIVRLGYARQPKTVYEGLTDFKNANIFTGGAGIFVSPVSLDFYLSQHSFGLTAGYRF